VSYRGLSNEGNYSELDWQVFVDGRVVSQRAFVIHGPEPPLGVGQLPRDRVAEGWLLYEVPAAGQVLLSYAPNFRGPPVFEVEARAA
jgi:hypothetical protein